MRRPIVIALGVALVVSFSAPSVVAAPGPSAVSTPNLAASSSANATPGPIDLDRDPPSLSAPDSPFVAVPSSDADERVRVVITVEAYTGDRADRLEASGLSVEARHGRHVQGTLPQSAVAALRGVPWVESIRRPSRPVTATTSEGVGAINASAVHAMNVTGENVTVGVIDTGFDPDNPEIADNVVGVRSFTGDISNNGRDTHGTAAAEIVVDVAPDADLYLANVGTGIQYANAVDWLVHNKSVDVITMSLGFHNQPFDGTGFISDVADNAVENGTVFVTSAGNSADTHWEGAWNDTDGDGWLEFRNGSEANYLNNGSTIRGSTTVYLSWDDWPASDQDYDLYLFRNESSGNDTVVDYSIETQDGRQEPTEQISTSVSKGVYYVAVENAGANGTNTLEIYDRSSDPLYYFNASSSLLDPANGDRVTTVGAFYHRTGDLEPFSSRGPTNDGRLGVDVTGPDGVTTSAESSFFGTSAAAPHAAGVIALVQAKQPSIDPAGVTRVLHQSARDRGRPGPDYAWGYGRLDALAAVETVGPSISVANLSVSPNETVVGHAVSVNVTARNAGTANGTANVTLYRDGVAIENRSVPVAVNDTQSVGFTTRFATAGAHNVTVNDLPPETVTVRNATPNVSVSYTASPTVVDVNETVWVNATARNAGTANGTANVTLYRDGVAVENRSVPVAVNESVPVRFRTNFSTAGEHNVTVNAMAPTAITVTDPHSDALASAERSIRSTSLAPGGSTTIALTLRTNASIDRLSIAEQFSPAFDAASVRSVRIDGSAVIPTSAVAGNDSTVVVLETVPANATVTVRYSVTLPANASAGTSFGVSGTVTTPAETVRIEGDGSITVARGVGRYADSSGIVRTSGLRAAIAAWVAGSIDTSLLLDVIDAWVKGTPV